MGQGQLDLDGEIMHYDGRDEEIEADHIGLATGSQPLIPDFVDNDDPSVVSSNRLISIDTLLETLTIVGGGVIGLEFATIFSNLGSRVTIVEFLDRVLAGIWAIGDATGKIALKTPLDDVAGIIHAHPTYSEIIRSILDYALGKATDFI